MRKGDSSIHLKKSKFWPLCMFFLTLKSFQRTKKLLGNWYPSNRNGATWCHIGLFKSNFYPMIFESSQRVTVDVFSILVRRPNVILTFMTKKMMRMIIPPTKQSKPRNRPLLALWQSTLQYPETKKSVSKLIQKLRIIFFSTSTFLWVHWIWIFFHGFSFNTMNFFLSHIFPHDIQNSSSN